MELNLSTRLCIVYMKAVESFTTKDSAKDSTAEQRCRKTEPNSCRGRSDNANLLKGTDIIISFFGTSSVEHGREQYKEVNLFAVADPEPFVNVFAPNYNSEALSSREITIPESNQSTLPHEHIRKWTDSYPLDNIIGNPSRPVSTRKQLAMDALWCFYNSVLSKVKPKNFTCVVTEDCWFQAMQEEIHEFDQLDVWELIPPPDSAMIITLKWIYKVKLDEHGDVLKNKARLVAKGFRQEEGLDFENPSPRLLVLEASRIFYCQCTLSKNMTGTINMESLYPKDSDMALTAYARRRSCRIVRDTRRSTSGNAFSFLGDNVSQLAIKESN
ncbi:retrovirus-related pol polyprotein from transposon TNT 1-94 [Tanacetum coccineum]